MDLVRTARRMYKTWSCLLAPDQHYQILDLFASMEYVALEITRSVY